MQEPQYQIAHRIAARISQYPEVEAIGLAGSLVTGRANAASDIDIYVYPSADMPAEQRLSLGQEFSADAQISDYWGPAVVWHDPETHIEVEALFFNTRWMEELVLQPLEQHQARTGFTTCFWHTIRVSHILFDRNGWLNRLQHKAGQPYPDELVTAIILHNYPLLRDIYFSYRAQIASAIKRQDLMIIQQKVFEFLASYFDILFAINRLPHPGVKRMPEFAEDKCPVRPANLREQVNRLLELAGRVDDKILENIDRLVDELEGCFIVQNLSRGK